MRTRYIIIGLFVAFGLTSCYYDNKEELYQFIQDQTCTETISSVSFNADIVPLLLDHCNRCHRNGRQDGNVNLEGFNNVKPYVSDGSLFGTTNHEPGWAVMPTNGIKIPSCEIEKMRMWIAEGALNN